MLPMRYIDEEDDLDMGSEAKPLKFDVPSKKSLS
jgi:hypothetical protein